MRVLLILSQDKPFNKLDRLMKKWGLKYRISLFWMVGFVFFIAMCNSPENIESDKGAESFSEEHSETDSELGEITGAIGVSVGVLGTLGSSDQDKQKEQTISFETIESGTQSNITDTRNVVINSQEEWEVLWKEHQLESLEVPEIDFTKKTVIGVFSGERSSGGYTIEIDQIVATGKTMTVSALETTPGTSCFVTLSLTYPYHLIQIQKTDKALQFTTQSHVNTCQE